MLSGRRIVLGITGSIAAYKAADIARQLVKAGAEVTAVLTANACRFITPLTLRTLTNNPAVTDFFGDASAPMQHISLAQWADLILVAPATADSLARAATGRAEDLLSALLLDTKAPVVWAPAMNTCMWQHPATREHVALLTTWGHCFVKPEAGELACGDIGEGRLAAVDSILSAVEQALIPSGPLAGKRVLITAGPTREPWDAVRFLSSRSTGKMGFCLAREAVRRGAQVTLVSGPVELAPPAGVDCKPVTTAREMYTAALAAFPTAEIVIAAAAVSDFRPAHPATEKIKKHQPAVSLELAPNPDILLELSKQKAGRILVGFAAETDDPVAAGIEKRRRKNCDLLVANYASGADDAFAADAAKVFIIDRQDQAEELPKQPKEKIAAAICGRIEKLLS